MPKSNAFGPARKWRSLHFPLAKHRYPGLLVVFDGIDGSGKTTCAEHMHGKLKERALPSCVTRLPSDDLRNHAAWKQWHGDYGARNTIDEFGLSLMSLGDRLVHQSMVIEPALKDGTIVLCDRYLLSILVYWSSSIHREVCSKFLAPDLAVFCSIPIAVAFDRCRTTRNEPSHLHSLQLLGQHDRRYRSLYRGFNYVSIATDRPPEDVQTELMALLDIVHRSATRSN